MPERALSRACVRRLLATALAGAALCGIHRSAAADCVETPTTEPGRWVYHVDRATRHKCWHRIPEAAAGAPAQQPQAAAAGPAAAAPAQEQTPSSLLSRVYNGISQSLSYEPQSQQQQQQYQQQYQQYQQQYLQYQQYQQQQYQYQTQGVDPAAEQHRLRRRMVRHERPQPPAQPATTGAAVADQGTPPAARSAAMPAPAESVVQSPVQGQPAVPSQASAQVQSQVQSQVPAAIQSVPPGEDRHDVPLNVADREALFQDFMKWQLERSMFGR